MNNTLIILDWDDTLFPTSWTIKQNINVNNADPSIFSDLDKLLYKLLKQLIKCGKVIIVTNAMTKWVYLSSKVLPKTKKIIKNNIEIISAREKYQSKYPNDIFTWKKQVFKTIVMHYYNNQKTQNIVSVCDADYEFKALINLWNSKYEKYRILKTVRFMSSPTYEQLLDQLNVLLNSVNNICHHDKHLDLVFNISV